MNYDKLLSGVNTIFNNSYNILFRPLVSNIKNTYYLSKNILLEDAVYFQVVLEDTINDNASALKLSKKPKICFIKTELQTGNDIIYIDNQMVFLCFIPTDISYDNFDAIERIRILYNLFKYVIDNTKPDISKQSIYGKVLSTLPEYLTVTSVYLCFQGIDYKFFKDVFPNDTLVTQRKFTEILDTDKPYIMDYGYIYGLLVDNK